MFQARERHDFLNRYPHGWPVEEFLKTYLKNKRAYARKRGYLTDINQKPNRYDDVDDDDGEEQEQDEQEQDEQEQDEQEQENGEIEEGDGWFNRGNGWAGHSTNREEEEDEDIYGSPLA